jgi:hypothetical protein
MNSIEMTEWSRRALGPLPERRRPAPRKPGLHAAAEAAKAEDRIVAVLSGPGCEVTAVQAATAVELACRAAATWRKIAQSVSDAGWQPYVYHFDSDDAAFLDHAQDACPVEPDHNILARLEREITDKLPFDSAMLSTLRAAEYLLKQYEMSKVRVHQ